MIRRFSVLAVCGLLSLFAMGCMSALAPSSGAVGGSAQVETSIWLTPSLSGEITGPDTVIFGSGFEMMLIVTNNGRGTAYDVTATLSPSDELSVGSETLLLGDFRRGQTKSFTFRVTAGNPGSQQTASISAMLRYANMSSGPRTWYSQLVSNQPVLLSQYEGELVTVELRTSRDPVHQGVVTVYDINGHALLTRTTETAAHVAFNLPPGTYTFNGGGRNLGEEIVSGQKKNVPHADRDSYVVVWLCPALTWSDCDLRNNPPLWAR